MKNRKTLKTLLCASSSLMMAMAAISPVATNVIPVMATDPAGQAQTDGSITIHDMPASTSYDVYQLFTGEWTESGKFINVKFANTSVENILVQAYQNTTGNTAFSLKGTTSDAKAAEMAAAISGLTGPTQHIKFANELAKLLNPKEGENPISSLTTVENSGKDTADGTASLVGPKTGYYVLVPTDRDGEVTDTTDAILYEAKTANIEVYSKDVKGRPHPEKTVTSAGWKDGKFDLHYTITSTVSTNIADYDRYKFVVKDVLPEGLITTEEDVKGNWSVSISFSDGTEDPVTLAPSNTTVTTDESLKQSTITWTFDDLISTFTDAGIEKGNWKNQKITITYDPVVDEDDKAAMFGAAKQDLNPITNTVSVEYPNDPHAGGEGTKDQTPDIPAKKYVYSVSITKVDDKGHPLEGASFTLKNSETQENVMEVQTPESNTFLFTGLVAGTYTLEETNPAGYEQVEPITFEITENADVETDGYTLTYTSKNKENYNVTWNEKNSDIQVKVINKSTIGGLPITGEAGIMLGLGTGGVIIAISAVSMLRRKKEIEE